MSLKLRLRRTAKRNLGGGAKHLQRAASHLDQADRAFDSAFKKLDYEPAKQARIGEYSDIARKLARQVDVLRDDVMKERKGL